MGRRLEEYTHEELIEYIKTLKKQKRFGLVWEDKPENVVRECETKLPVVKEIMEKRIENAPGEPTNIIIEGDNYHALSVLNYTHAGKIDVIYIDPPYNTGNKDFIYNDCYVDKEDTFRHSKWLSFMEKRLRLAKNLLADDGVIFISIDDNEQADLKQLCDSVFNEENFIDCFIWRRSGTGGLRGIFPVTTHEYMLCYALKKNRIVSQWLASYSEASLKDFKYEDEGGKYKTQALYLTSLKHTESQSYPIELPDGSIAKPPDDIGAWRFIEETYKEFLNNGLIIFKEVKNSPLFLEDGRRARYNIYTKQYISNDGTNPPTIFPEELVGQTRAARAELKRIFKSDVFPYAKPCSLINYILKLVNKKGSIVVLDFFAGSGTTGQAVMELNKEDGGHRQFILVTNNEANGQTDAGAEGIAEKVTYPRIKTVITGIRPDGTKYSDGIPANLRYFKTDFVEKGKTTDDTREALITECCDMIRMRENAFEHVASAPEYRFYKNDKVFVPIIFDQFAIAETWELVEKLNTEKLSVHCYNFSYNRHANEEEIPEDTELTWTACSIPETVLEVYRKIFRKKEA